MADRLNFYDFLSYIVPGTVVLLIILYLAQSVVGFDLITVGSVNSVSETTLLLVFGYLAGHLVQGFGREVELKRKTSGVVTSPPSF